VEEKEEKYILCLDLSLSNSGVSVLGADGHPECVYSISTNSKDERNKRLKLIGDELKKTIEKYSISEVAMEMGFSRYRKSTEILYNVQGVARYILSEYPMFSYASSSVKKTVAGRGNSSKKEVQDAILKRYPTVRLDDFDQSDSLAVGVTHLIEKGTLKK
jgi:crossover junction endodeoxyribonuclease RuvC